MLSDRRASHTSNEVPKDTSKASIDRAGFVCGEVARIAESARQDVEQLFQFPETKEIVLREGALICMIPPTKPLAEYCLISVCGGPPASMLIFRHLVRKWNPLGLLSLIKYSTE